MSVPPWWRMQKKHAMFYTGLGRGDYARFMILASLLCADSVEEVSAVDAYAPDIRAFIASLKPPAYPFPIDRASPSAGRPVFEAHCSGCHGKHGADASYPNLIVPLETVGTDPAYARAATDGSEDRFYEWVERSPYKDGVQLAPAAGYAAPPLDGCGRPHRTCTTGPCRTCARCSTAEAARGSGGTRASRYDPAVLGWRTERLEQGKAAVPDREAQARIYDTTVAGYGNGGHVFGDALTDAERTAVIEYLKTLLPPLGLIAFASARRIVAGISTMHKIVCH